MATNLKNENCLVLNSSLSTQIWKYTPCLPTTNRGALNRRTAICVLPAYHIIAVNVNVMKLCSLTYNTSSGGKVDANSVDDVKMRR